MDELKAKLDAQMSRIVSALRSKYEFCAQRVDHLASALAPALESRASDAAHRVDSLSSALGSSVVLNLTRRESEFERLRTKLAMLSPYSVLERGYSLTTDACGAVVKSADQVKPGDVIMTRLASGALSSTVR